MKDCPPRGHLFWRDTAVVSVLAAAAFALRLGHMLSRIFYIDEFFTMLAAREILSHGLPVLPSGVVYNHGLLISYLIAAFSAICGFDELIARWPDVLLGTFTVAAFYAASRRLTGSRAAGIIAAALVAFNAEMVVWSGRARMYTSAQLFLLLAIALVGMGLITRPAPRYRYAALACFFAGAHLSHLSGFMLIPPLAVACLLALLPGGRWKDALASMRKTWAWEAVFAAAIPVGAAMFVAMGHYGSTVSFSTSPTQGGKQGMLSGFLEIGLGAGRFDEFAAYLLDGRYAWLVVLAGAAFLFALYKLARRSADRRDAATLFVSLTLLLLVLEMGLTLAPSWRRPRYVFILAVPPLILLASDGLARVGKAASGLLATGHARERLEWAYPLAAVAVVALAWGREAWAQSQLRSTGGYDTAYEYVESHMADGDAVMSYQTAAAYLYLGRSDFYASQVSAKVLLDEEMGEVDRYVGSRLVGSIDDLNGALEEVASGGGRLWFVIDEGRLWNRYEPDFAMQVLARMEMVSLEGDMYVFRSYPYRQTLPLVPDVPLEADFGGFVRLAGYSLRGMEGAGPGSTVQLGLFWQPTGPPPPVQLKIFVHLRDGADNTVAQADHFLGQGLIYSGEWERMRGEGKTIRDAAYISLPPDLGAGEYRLLVGVYDPATMGRVPLANDTGGESAALLAAFSIGR